MGGNGVRRRSLLFSRPGLIFSGARKGDEQVAEKRLFGPGPAAAAEGFLGKLLLIRSARRKRGQALIFSLVCRGHPRPVHGPPAAV